MNGCSAILRAICAIGPISTRCECTVLPHFTQVVPPPPTPASFRKAERLKVLQQPERRVSVRDTRAAVRKGLRHRLVLLCINLASL